MKKAALHNLGMSGCFFHFYFFTSYLIDFSLKNYSIYMTVVYLRRFWILKTVDFIKFHCKIIG